MSKLYQFEYQGTKTGRLDRVILDFFSDQEKLSISRSQIKNLIEAGKVQLNGQQVEKAGTPVKIGMSIICDYELTDNSSISAFDFELEVLFEDLDILVINKPAGIVAHPGAGNKEGTLLNALVAQVEKSGLRPQYFCPGMPHRLDKDTTGVMLLTKTEMAKSRLSKQFAKHSVDRAYHALTFYTPRSRRALQLEDQGTIKNRLGRHPNFRTKMAVVAEGGREAITNWQIIERFTYGSLVECRLQTGRTHQIRIHLSEIGSPIIGDQTYGDFTGLPKKLEILAKQFGRQALHAKHLGFYHPVSLQKMFFESPLPADYIKLLEAFRDLKINDSNKH